MNKSIHHLFFWLSAILIIFTSYSCQNKFKVDLSNIEKPKIEIKRYEKDLFGQPLDDDRFDELQKKYPLFLGNLPLNPEQKNQLANYVSDPYLQKIYVETDKIFPTLKKEEEDLSQVFRYLKYYFPSFDIPQVYSYISGSQEEAYFEDQVLVFSLDRYLGYGHELYHQSGTPKYIQAKMKADFIIRDILTAIAKYYIPEPSIDEHLMAHMIYYGKIIYFIKSMNPEITDELLFAQTEHHIQWLNDKSKHLWRYYIENELLFNADYETYKKFMAEAPFTSVLGDNSAPRTGRWLGFQIVNSFMDNNEIPLSEMIQIPGDQAFLNRSKYKP